MSMSDVLGLLLYCDHSEERAKNDALLKPPARTHWAQLDTRPSDEWVLGVIPLIKRASTRTCVTDNCNGTGWVTQPIIRSMKRHDACGGTGKITDEHTTLRVALSCAQAAVEVFEQGMRDECSSPTMHDSPAITGPRKILKVIQDYLDAPTDANAIAWANSISDDYQSFVPMPFQAAVMLDYRLSIEESAKLVGRDAIRKIIVETTTQECPTCSGPEGGDMEHELCGGTGRIAR